MSKNWKYIAPLVLSVVFLSFFSSTREHLSSDKDSLNQKTFDKQTIEISELKKKDKEIKSAKSSYFKLFKKTEERKEKEIGLFNVHSDEGEKRDSENMRLRAGLSFSETSSFIEESEKEEISFVKKKITFYYSPLQAKVYRKNYLSQSSFRVFKEVVDQKDSSFFTELEAIEYSEELEKVMKKSCEGFKSEKEYISCDGSIFKKIKNDLIVLVKGKNGCHFNDQNFELEVRPLNFSWITNLREEESFNTKSNFYIPLSSKISPLKAKKMTNNLIEFSHTDELVTLGNKGEEYFLLKKSSTETLCFYGGKIEFEKGEDGSVCKKDEDCLNGCCQNRACKVLSYLDGETCSKENGQSCLDSNYCSYDQGYPLWVANFSRRKNSCQKKQVNGSFNPCYKGKCLPIYKYVVEPSYPINVTEKNCTSELQPDFLNEYIGVQSSNPKKVRRKYFP